MFLNLSNLVVLVADSEYMLAMKSLSARIDGTDSKDIEFLIKELELDPNKLYVSVYRGNEKLNIPIRKNPVRIRTGPRSFGIMFCMN